MNDGVDIESEICSITGIHFFGHPLKTNLFDENVRARISEDIALSARRFIIGSVILSMWWSIVATWILSCEYRIVLNEIKIIHLINTKIDNNIYDMTRLIKNETDWGNF